jgi:hypothetical protein
MVGLRSVEGARASSDAERMAATASPDSRYAETEAVIWGVSGPKP